METSTQTGWRARLWRCVPLPSLRCSFEERLNASTTRAISFERARHDSCPARAPVQRESRDPPPLPVRGSVNVDPPARSADPELGRRRACARLPGRRTEPPERPVVPPRRPVYGRLRRSARASPLGGGSATPRSRRPLGRIDRVARFRRAVTRPCLSNARRRAPQCPSRAWEGRACDRTEDILDAALPHEPASTPCAE